MQKTVFRLIGVAACLLVVPMTIGAQILPEWVENPPGHTAETIHIVMKGTGKTLQEAKDNMSGSIGGIVENELSANSVQFTLEVGGNDSIVELSDNQGNWFNDNAWLIDTFSTDDEEGIIYCYALYGLPQEAWNSMFEGLVYWYFPALKYGSIENVVYSAASQLAREIPKNTKVAVLSFASDDKELGEFILEETTGYLSSAGTMNLFDRYSLESIRQEQKFQMTGDVDDDSAVSIGQFAGADIVITGSITGSGSTRRLRFKALDVKTGAILSQTSHRY
jgi:hypothetical protein